MTPPDSGEHREWCRSQKFDAQGRRLPCDCKPDSGEREARCQWSGYVGKRAGQCKLRSRHDGEHAIPEPGAACKADPRKYSRHPDARCVLTGDHQRHKWEFSERDPDPEVEISLNLAQRILAALEREADRVGAGHRDDDFAALASELRAAVERKP